MNKPLPPAKPTPKRNLPSTVQQKLPSIRQGIKKLELTKGLPNATIVYGVAAGAFFAFAIYLLIKVSWFDGLLTMLPAICFVGFAIHLMKYDQKGNQNR